VTYRKKTPFWSKFSTLPNGVPSVIKTSQQRLNNPAAGRSVALTGLLYRLTGNTLGSHPWAVPITPTIVSNQSSVYCSLQEKKKQNATDLKWAYMFQCL